MNALTTTLELGLVFVKELDSVVQDQKNVKWVGPVIDHEELEVICVICEEEMIFTGEFQDQKEDPGRPGNQNIWYWHFNCQECGAEGILELDHEQTEIIDYSGSISEYF